MIPTELIERALALTGKKMDDMNELHGWLSCLPYSKWDLYLAFSIEKFCYYLHDFKFIEKYIKLTTSWLSHETVSSYYACLWSAIAMYRDWDEQPLITLIQPLITLIEKIPK